MVKRVKDLGMNSVAVTDHGNLYGAIEFYREATSAGLNPILGYEAYVAPAGRAERDGCVGGRLERGLTPPTWL